MNTSVGLHKIAKGLEKREDKNRVDLSPDEIQFTRPVAMQLPPAYQRKMNKKIVKPITILKMPNSSMITTPDLLNNEDLLML